jgi:hypothetical protein
VVHGCKEAHPEAPATAKPQKVITPIVIRLTGFFQFQQVRERLRFNVQEVKATSHYEEKDNDWGARFGGYWAAGRLNWADFAG